MSLPTFGFDLWETRLDDNRVQTEVMEHPPGLVSAIRDCATTGKPVINPNDGSFTRLVVFLPGNFAAIHLYQSFMSQVIQDAPGGLALIAFAYPGLCRTERNNSREFTLQNYIDLVTEFFSGFLLPRLFTACAIRPDRVAIAAHSVGGYIAIQTMKNVPSICHGILIAPVLMHFEAAPAGKGQRKFLHPASVWMGSYVVIGGLWLLPASVRAAISGGVGSESAKEKNKATLAAMMRPSFTWNALTLARTGFDSIKEPDEALFAVINDRLRCLFCEKDEWVPLENVARLKDRLATRAQIVVCTDKDITHSCCVTAPEKTGKLVASMFAW